MISNKDIIKGLKKAYLSIKPDQASIERSQAKLLAAYQEAFPRQQRDIFFYFRPVMALAAALFMFVVTSGGLVVSAQGAQPGNQLYGLKRVTEKIILGLTPSNQKKALRAEMVTRRLDEVKNLINQSEVYSPETLQQASVELEKEIAALKTELTGEKKEVASTSDLPVEDNQKIISAVTNQAVDLEKILLETKEAIRDNNIEMAMDKIGAVETIFYEEEQVNNLENKIEEPVQSEEKPTEIQPVEPKEILPVQPRVEENKNNQIVPVKPAPADFTVDVEMDAEGK